eukprot:780075-Pleurochrysis_carterae.AAC.2
MPVLPACPTLPPLSPALASTCRCLCPARSHVRTRARSPRLGDERGALPVDARHRLLEGLLRLGRALDLRRAG